MRYISPFVKQDLKNKMVFVGGPRQVGKTTLAQSLLSQHPGGGRYFNWDLDEDRHALRAKRWSPDEHLLVFDELHKHSRWKSWIKGVYDTQRERHQFLVTGSARLDVYRRGGDSLMGRYHYWRLHPWSVDERPPDMPPAEAMERLLRLGGFPEPFLADDERQARRWRRERFDRVIREDVRDLEQVRQIQLLSQFVDLLRERVGAPVVLAHLAADLEISPRTAKLWLDLCERMYLIFAVRPYTHKLPRAIRKPPKVYFFDPADLRGDGGARLEDLVACALLKRLHFIEDYSGRRCELRYLRDKEGREVDFAVLIDGCLVELIEVKQRDDKISRSLRYYGQRLEPRLCTQMVAELDRPYEHEGVRVVSAKDYLAGWSYQPGSDGEIVWSPQKAQIR